MERNTQKKMTQSTGVSKEVTMVDMAAKDTTLEEMMLEEMMLEQMTLDAALQQMMLNTALEDTLPAKERTTPGLGEPGVDRVDRAVVEIASYQANARSLSRIRRVRDIEPCDMATLLHEGL